MTRVTISARDGRAGQRGLPAPGTRGRWWFFLTLAVVLAGCGDASDAGPAVGWAAAWSASGGGAILTTSDDGRTWAVQHATSAPLRTVDFVDRRYGWAGGDGVLLRTLDGGSTWVRPASFPFTPSAARVTDVNFGSAERGMVRGILAYPVNFCLYTDDAGQTWIPCESVSSETSYGTVGQLCWTSPTESLAVLGDAVYRSAGPGVWSAFSALPPNVRATLFACRASSAWAFGADLLVPLPDFAFVSAAVRSDDGGHTWTPNLLPDLGMATGLVAADAAGRSHAWLLATRFGASVEEPEPLVVATQDAGASWWTQDLGRPRGFAASLSFADESVGVAAGNDLGDLGQPFPPAVGWIRYTGDGGASWHAAGVPEGIGRILEVALVR